ncbi:PP2C family protein-serine/threonine phosphatase [Bifidobacterium avesanii]|uniref:Phosphoprotein phosphatase n=1 Tax=Bifidobacterium avesanii TaxID=1798157 RepID=A0A7K3TKY3_9BIFI|nr:protein phosphatase 2C domain-containing protein [Bifidobacterium avesanii]KAB8290119.1 phosphoprotein phosphatase [Bifidobacterium avesanii]NEG78933.1 phosphoprotein phosphatase [Bifidobacterium avesanii]
MPDSSQLFLYSTTVSDVGYVRSNNQDSSFAGEHLIAICDGMGGHAGGDTASTIAIRSLAHIEHDDTTNDVKAVADMLEASVLAAHDAIVGKARRERKLSGMGTTVTAVALVGGYWVMSHIGDSRAYLLRDGNLMHMTQDHSYVQHLIDTGHITPAEAKNHPQRNVVMRVLGDFDIDPRPDIMIHAAKPADRWLLCSDGLCGVLADSTIAQTLASVADQNECAQQLVQMALKAGSTDNVTAVVADATLALDANAFDLPHQTPLIGGAASASLEPIADIIDKPVAAAPKLKESGSSPASRAAALVQAAEHKTPENGGQPAAGADAGQASADVQRVAQPAETRAETGEMQVPDTGEIPVIMKRDGRMTDDPFDPDVVDAIQHDHRTRARLKHNRRRRGRAFVTFLLVLVAVALGGGAYGTYRWSQTRYYLGEDSGMVAIYQGVPTNIFGWQLSHVVETTHVPLDDLPQNWRDQLRQGIAVDSLDAARERARYVAEENLSMQQASASPTASASTSTSASADATASTGASATPSDAASPTASPSSTGQVSQQ